jgi:hypothetical protein
MKTPLKSILQGENSFKNHIASIKKLKYAHP